MKKIQNSDNSIFHTGAFLGTKAGGLFYIYGTDYIGDASELIYLAAYLSPLNLFSYRILNPRHIGLMKKVADTLIFPVSPKKKLARYYKVLQKQVSKCSPNYCGFLLQAGKETLIEVK